MQLFISTVVLALAVQSAAVHATDDDNVLDTRKCDEDDFMKLVPLGMSKYLKTCQTISGFSMIPPSQYPTAAQNDIMCQSEECLGLMDDVLKADPSDCTMDFNGFEMNVKVMVDKFYIHCKAMDNAATSEPTTVPYPITPASVEPLPSTPSVSPPASITPATAEPLPTVSPPASITPATAEPLPSTPSVSPPASISPATAEPLPSTPSVSPPASITPATAEPLPSTPTVSPPAPISPAIAKPLPSASHLAESPSTPSVTHRPLLLTPIVSPVSDPPNVSLTFTSPTPAPTSTDDSEEPSIHEDC